MSFVCYNGVFVPADQPGLFADNRSYKWGDGIFETIKVHKGRLLLRDLHFDRLLTSLQLLQIRLLFTLQELESNILDLCARNRCSELARVRLAVYRDHENATGYTIEAVPLDPIIMQWQEEGMHVDIYPFSRKACDILANLKTANYLPYIMAGRYAEESDLQECLVLNSHDHICDASKANIFIIKDQDLLTPALDQGCISGVVRRLLIEEAEKHGWSIKQSVLTERLLLEADECFLTNAIQGIRWVNRYRDKQFASFQSRKIFETIYSTIAS